MSDGLPAKRSMLPASILGAGALVGLGLYFGLRERSMPPSPVPASSPVTTVSPSPIVSAPVAVSAPLVVSVTATPASDRAKAAAASLEVQRKRIVETCWKPAAAKEPEPASVKLVFNVAFGADGKQIGRGVSEERKRSRPEVTACVQRELVPLTVPPSTEGIAIDLAWELP